MAMKKGIIVPAFFILSCSIISLQTVKALDPDVWLDAVELVTSKGYPCEEHSVTTEDGYTLKMQRIPYGYDGPPKNKSGVVFLMHCLECDATVFITNFPNQSLGFILADAGYDVWMGNVRGSIYSREHVKYTPREYKFWEWTWDEMAKYDLPAFLNYVTNHTHEEKVYYIGFSQGTMMGFAGFSTYPAVRDKVKLFSAMAPVAHLGNIESPLKYGVPIVEDVQILYRLAGYGQFLPPTKLFNKLEVELCRNVDVMFKEACVAVYYLVAGREPVHQLNTSRLEVYFSHTPSGTSTLNVNHYAQQVVSNLFQAYDWGSKAKNKEHYGQPVPPVYDLKNLTVPTALFHGTTDTLADLTDVAWVKAELPNLVYERQYDYFNHLDFIWGLNAASTVYPDIINLMKQY